MSKTTKTEKKAAKPTEPPKPAAKPAAKPEPVKTAPKTAKKLTAKAPLKVAATAAPLPSWPREAQTYDELTARVEQLLAVRPVAAHRPAPGLVRVYMSDHYVARVDYRRYLAVNREISIEYDNYLAKHLADAARWAIKSAGGDEEEALLMLDISYHNDRGDGLLYVPAFRRRKWLSDWISGASAAGVNTRVRAC